ncbi:MAG: MBL fold metallo-hydrolase [Anaerolineae bacterium]|nr:MBL fold metallo-hydrolase [Anaerolineae bacterium]
MIEQIRWLGHGSIVIEGSPILYINPWRIVRTAFHADAILVTSDSYDLCSSADIEKLRGPATHLIGSEQVAAQVDNVTVLRAWQSVSVDRASIKAIPIVRAKADGTTIPVDGSFGYVVSENYYDIYYTGHTSIMPQMQYMHPDIAIIPVDQRGGYTLDDAIALVDTLRPRWVIPCNWGTTDYGASQVVAQEFRKRVEGVTEVVMPNNATR